MGVQGNVVEFQDSDTFAPDGCANRQLSTWTRPNITNWNLVSENTEPSGWLKTPSRRTMFNEESNARLLSWRPLEDEPVKWLADDIEEAKEAVPNYKLIGPEKYAICFGESGLVGPRNRLIRSVRNVMHIEEAAALCDSTPNCTHFSWTAGPDPPLGYEVRMGRPYRVDLCRGDKISVKDIPGLNTFVGIKQSPLDRAPPRPPRRRKILGDGPLPDVDADSNIEASGLPAFAAALPLLHLHRLTPVPSSLRLVRSRRRRLLRRNAIGDQSVIDCKPTSHLGAFL